MPRDPYISKEDMRQIVDHCRSTIQRPDSFIKDYAKAVAVLLFRYTGIRNIELSTIQPNHIDFGKRQLWISAAKGGESRWVKYGEDEALQAGLMALAKHQRLFEVLSDRIDCRKQLERGVIETIEEALKRKHNYRTHSFRHTLARDCLAAMPNNPNALRIVKRKLGHKNINNTIKYLDALLEDEAVEAITGSKG